MSIITTKKKMREAIEGKLLRHYGSELSEASREDIFKACALVLRDEMAQRRSVSKKRNEEEHVRQVHYMSLEFLIGRSFMNNAYNLGMYNLMRDTLADMGIELADILEAEPDAGLGNGGLGRLAACYLDSMASLGLDATGYSIRYEHGLFKQRIVDGQQTELPDSWLDVGEVWLIPHMDDVQEVKFGGQVKEYWEPDGRMSIALEDATTVLAVPYDMLIAGHDTDNVCKLRLWSAKSPVELDMTMFSRGEYLKAVEQHAMAEVISKILYPDDNHIEGKALRLKQQYFFVSATVQNIVHDHRRQYGTLRNFAEKHVIQLNDTHPVMVIPELMRILMDEERIGWDEAWNIVTHTVAYTNHTVMAEALEQWPQQLFQQNVPRIWQILDEMNRRLRDEIQRRFPGRTDLPQKMLLIYGGMVRMANIAVYSAFSVNGVSALHSKIIKNDVFNDFYRIMPDKFTNVTNGIAHRRWLCEINPGLADFITQRIGDGYVKKPSELKKLTAFKTDRGSLDELARIKRKNKERLAARILRENGVKADPDSIFDCQVKRLHEYKRQLLNVMRILDMYQRIKANPNGDYYPRTFIFGAKAFPGYVAAKKIIQLINSVSKYIENDSQAKDLIRTVFMENYRVTLAEDIMPAAEVSEQISTAGKEASGTSNMKFMINGALTVGTLDGANVEIKESVGDENCFIFGLTADEVNEIRRNYNPSGIYYSNSRLKAVLDMIDHGFGDGVSYHDLFASLLYGVEPDRYMLLADFGAYCNTQDEVTRVYRDKKRWNRMSLANIANAGRFSSDRSVYEYSKKIWHVDADYEA